MGELTSGEKREMRQRNVSIISGFIGAITSAAGLLIAYIFYKNYNIVANLNDEAKGLIIKGIAIVEAQSPVVPRLKRSRCRSSQEVNDSPTPFSALNYC